MSEEKQKNNSFSGTGFLVGQLFTRTAGEHTIVTGRINILSRKKDRKFFVDIEAWNEQADILLEAGSGARISIEDGYFTTEEWDDKATGDKRSKIVLTVNGVGIISYGDADKPASAPASKSAGKPAPKGGYQKPQGKTSYGAPKTTSQRTYGKPAAQEDDEDSIPF